MKQFKLSSSRFLLVLMCVSAGLWIAFAKLVVPPIIESAYRGESLPALKRYNRGAARQSHKLFTWINGMALAMALLVLTRPSKSGYSFWW